MARTNFLIQTLMLMIWVVDSGIAVHEDEPYILSIRTLRYHNRRNNTFVPIPETTRDRGIEDYRRVRLERSFPYLLSLYCLRNDPRLCFFYDKRRRLAGVQFSYLTKDLSALPPDVYDTSNRNYKDTIIYGIPLKSVRIYFTNPNNLTVNGDTTTPDEEIDGLWTELEGELVRYDSKCQPNSPVIGEFVMLGCVPKVGQFFAYRFDEHHDCRTSYFLYLIYDRGALVAFGHGIPGKVSQGPEINVFNYPTRPVLEKLLPHPSPCLEELAAYGFTSIGLSLIDDPWTVNCPKCLCN